MTHSTTDIDAYESAGNSYPPHVPCGDAGCHQCHPDRCAGDCGYAALAGGMTCGDEVCADHEVGS